MSQPVVEISHVAKRFGSVEAVRDVSFDVQRGELFGLLGPNGAGKTTTIRLILDIFRPDRGRIALLGGPMDEAKKNRIGYMPEERGLYQEMAVEQCLLYLAALKGMAPDAARQRLSTLLERFDLARHRKKKVKELSRGMQQKAQIIATVVHAPELLIVDEPFSGLDPVNTRLVKDLLAELRADGTTVIMSTHMMHQVEALCDRIVLIDDGRTVLYGAPDAIRRRYAGNALRVALDGALPIMDGVTAHPAGNGGIRLTLDRSIAPEDVLRRLVSADVGVRHFEIDIPTLDEVFVSVVTAADEAEAVPSLNGGVR